jgi:geranylgeranyl diphosphate synthase type I
MVSDLAGPLDLGRAIPWGGELPGMPDLDDALLGPVRDFASRDSKQVRAQLVRIGFELARGNQDDLPSDGPLLNCLYCVVEALHAGSLVIDDIQDASEVRRGQPALHVQIGVPLAINAANWLYFWPADLIRQQGIAPELELAIYRLYHSTMIRAHYGQALDLGHDMAQVTQGNARDISMASIELKTGELMSMCAELGALAGGADDFRRTRLSQFGRRFGVALQMFNDIAELMGDMSCNDNARSFRRPSLIWAVAASELQPAAYEEFRRVMCDPDETTNGRSLSDHPVVLEATRRACEEMQACIVEATSMSEGSRSAGTVSALNDLARKVMNTYA